ncbi:hypothetical protein BBK82_30075 [Lentzea guizhouensis]|uniref:HTH-type transcriptional regulator AraC-type N-terminal domain-containing protein n=1 Tax=Lentzea guizhouensis TaxID=1586287 RepID=A0A1B2HPL9_9PSEU|nr:AraC family transcriptional regulator ligand-binding domain-containing protein [Lentzea guizhouensis]ANZ39660.1 hypothetical protein BBK82_30075 [Lentzea guizhouensis]
MRTLAEPATRHWDFPRGIASVALLLRFGAEHGVPRPVLLDGSDITDGQLADPAAEINARQELAVVRNLAARLPHAGVAAGRHYHATTFGVLGHAFLSAATRRGHASAPRPGHLPHAGVAAGRHTRHPRVPATRSSAPPRCRTRSTSHCATST